MRHNTARLATLKQLTILDTAPEVVFDDLTRTVAGAFGVPIAMVNLLDADRDWFKSCLGLPFSESPAETSFCEVFLTSPQDIVIVEDTTKDPRFASHPLVVGPPRVRFYAAARLAVKGDTVGTLCVYDTVPRQVSKDQIEQLEVLSRAAVESLAARTGLY
ncbi:MAG: GAF domain-containing protein [Polaromonas sp.]|uniref:GAF domain-containing protein n=1 Tax=Polaromonas sp. TaxID=1869339 RepID=UPI0025E27ADA|nr:GAF domain-containing protein [Polaromonas sp.]MBI2725011.1 GAF domain-containing protein [Polaromonas sp.]